MRLGEAAKRLRVSKGLRETVKPFNTRTQAALIDNLCHIPEVGIDAALCR